MLIMHHRIGRLLNYHIPPDLLEMEISISAPLLDILIAVQAKSPEAIRLGIHVILIDDWERGSGVFVDWFTKTMKMLFTSSAFEFDNGIYRPTMVAEQTAAVIGRLLAMSVREGIPVGVQLNYGLLAQLLGKDEGWTIEDLERDDPTTSFRRVAECRQNKDCIGQLYGQQFDGGEDVTEENLDEFVQWYLDDKLSRDVYIEIVSGFQAILPLTVFQHLIDPQELGEILMGNTQVTVEYLKANYRLGHEAFTTDPIGWLWEFLEEDGERPKKFLTFVTGLTAAPVGKLHQILTFMQVDYNPVDPYPRAHVCSATIDLPDYPNKEALVGAMIIALEQTHFGLV